MPVAIGAKRVKPPRWIQMSAGMPPKPEPRDAGSQKAAPETRSGGRRRGGDETRPEGHASFGHRGASPMGSPESRGVPAPEPQAQKRRLRFKAADLLERRRVYKARSGSNAADREPARPSRTP